MQCCLAGPFRMSAGGFCLCCVNTIRSPIARDTSCSSRSTNGHDSSSCLIHRCGRALNSPLMPWGDAKAFLRSQKCLVIPPLLSPILLNNRVSKLRTILQPSDIFVYLLIYHCFRCGASVACCQTVHGEHGVRNVVWVKLGVPDGCEQRPGH